MSQDSVKSTGDSTVKTIDVKPHFRKRGAQVKGAQAGRGKGGAPGVLTACTRITLYTCVNTWANSHLYN